MQTRILVGEVLTNIEVDKLFFTSSAEDKILLPYCGELADEMLERAYIISLESSGYNMVDFPEYEQVVKNAFVRFCFHVGSRVCGVVAHLYVEPPNGKIIENKFVVRLLDDVIEPVLERFFCGTTGLCREYEDLYRSNFLLWKTRHR